MRRIGRIYGLGNVESSVPILPIAGGVASTGLLVGGLVVRKTAGTVMGVVGGVGLAASVTALIIKLVSKDEAAPATAPAAQQTPPPPTVVISPPPSAPKLTTSDRIYQYATQYGKDILPIANQLFSSIFGGGTESSAGTPGLVTSLQGPKSMWSLSQPSMMVVR